MTKATIRVAGCKVAVPPAAEALPGELMPRGGPSVLERAGFRVNVKAPRPGGPSGGPPG